VTLRPLCPVSVEHSSLPNSLPLHEIRLAAARYKEIPRDIVGLCLFKTQLNGSCDVYAASPRQPLQWLVTLEIHFIWFRFGLVTLTELSILFTQLNHSNLVVLYINIEPMFAWWLNWCTTSVLWKVNPVREMWRSAFSAVMNADIYVQTCRYRE
jgi:hypothetical protein